MTDMDPAIEEAPKEFYVAYRTSQNIVCMEVQKQKLLLFVKLDPRKAPRPPNISRDVSDIGHFGTGDLEITVRTKQDLAVAERTSALRTKRAGGELHLLDSSLRNK